VLPVQKDLVEEGIDRLLHQWEDKPVVVGLVASYLKSVQEVEDALFQILDERGLYTAVGSQLDLIGAIVGEDRLGRNDNDYRIGILGKIVANNSDGSTIIVLETLRALTGADNYNIFEHFPARVYYYADGGVTNGLVGALDTATSAGVATRVLYDLNQTMFLASELANLSEDVLVTEVLDNLQLDDGGGAENWGLGGILQVGSSTRGIFPELEGLGDELVTDVDFTNDLTDWTTVSGTPSATGGVATLDAGDAIGESVTTINGDKYRIVLNIDSSSATFVVKIGTTSGANDIRQFATSVQSKTSTQVTLEFTAITPTTYITLSDPTNTTTVSGVSCKYLYIPSGLQNPLCDVLDNRVFEANAGLIVDDLGNYVIDDNTNNISFISY